MAHRTPRSLLALLVGAMAWASPSWAGEKEDLIAKVEAKYSTVTSLRADFTQTNRSALFGDDVSSGEFLVARPAQMRWAFGTEKLFVADGKKMWIYTAADNQVIEYDDISSTPASADSILTSLDKINEMFDVDLLTSTESEHKLSLKPHEEAQFKLVQLKLDGELMIQQVIMTDTFDNVTELDFKNVELNVKTDASMFTFEAPAGVDVIKAN
jgi:outer membrane lipoprotein carrier protein